MTDRDEQRRDDERWLRRAFALAARAGAEVQPNPRVGAVLVREGRALGEGWHAAPGLPHAEPAALADARARGEEVAGATLYVSLEPCHRQGRTPPCTEAILAAGIRRVVFAMEDPNPAESGRSRRLLAEAGLEVDGGLLAGEAAALNPIYVHNQRAGRPYVVLKCAASLNGMIAFADGTSRWITGEAARRQGHRLRAEAMAVAVGGETARRDQPRLDLRLLAAPAASGAHASAGAGAGEDAAAASDGAAGARLPRPVVFDGDPPRCPADLDWAGRAPLLLVPQHAAEAAGAPYAARGWRVLGLPAAASGGLDLNAALASLYREGLASLLVEGGGRLLTAFLAAGLWQRWELFLAPRLLPADGRPFWTLAREHAPLHPAAIARHGDDIQLTFYPDSQGEH